MAEISLNTNVNNAITGGYSQKSEIQRTVAVGVSPDNASTFNATVMSGRTAVRPVSNNETRSNNTKTPDKESPNASNNETKDNEKPSKSIQLEFDKATGYPVIKFRDTKGNVVSQVPPEQFLKMRSVLGYNSRKEEIVENSDNLYSKKVGVEDAQNSNSGLSKDNNLSLYV